MKEKINNEANKNLQCGSSTICSPKWVKIHPFQSRIANYVNLYS